MKTALLLRGHNMLEKDRFGFPMDSRVCIDAFLKQILLPLQAQHEVKLYFVTYDSPALTAWIDATAPERVMLLDVNKSSQISTYSHGLKEIHDAKSGFDCIIALRFDLLYLKNFDDWNVKLDDSTLFFCWREYLAYWRDHRRVGDTIHIIGRKALPAFFNALQCVGILRPNMHLMYYIVSTLYGKIAFIEDGYWDSNTLYNIPEAFNPIYQICNRPRLDIDPSSYDKIIPEIQAP